MENQKLAVITQTGKTLKQKKKNQVNKPFNAFIKRTLSVVVAIVSERWFQLRDVHGINE